MVQKIRRCAYPACNKRLRANARANQEYCDNGGRCTKAASRATQDAESLFATGNTVRLDAHIAANMAKDYADSAINMQRRAETHDIKGVIFLPAASGVLVVFPATNQPWPGVMYDDDFPWFRMDWRECMLTSRWLGVGNIQAMSKDPNVTDFLNTIDGKARLKHRHAIDNILTGPDRHCLLLTLRPGGQKFASRPLWARTGPGPVAIDSYGVPMSHSFTLNHETRSERKARLAAEKAARQIEESINADTKRVASATARQEAGHARRRYLR